MRRDDFAKAVRAMAAARVGQHCSNPECQKLTSGPAADPRRSINIGEAAHITAASRGGPRYNPYLTPEERRSLDNAIWLCAACATLIDRDPEQFTVPLLRQWRSRAEESAALSMAIGSRYRPIAAEEVVQELTVGEMVAVKELEAEFGCHVETNVHVPAGTGWLRLDAAVVRGKDLFAININEALGNGIAYFQIGHLLELYSKHDLPQFRKCVPYFVVVSSGSAEFDAETHARLLSLTSASALETHIRIYRLDELRAKFGI